MKATDKQIKYLTALTNKVKKIIAEWSESGIDIDFQQWVRKVDWMHERSIGMTSVDASMKISAFRSLIQGVNMKRNLLGLKQF